MESSDGVGLYIHIPFCLAKCGYCDFNSYPGLGRLFGPYRQALLGELDQRLREDDAEIETVYFGGGTPTVAPTGMLADVLARVSGRRQRLQEVTMEANPGTVTAERLRTLRSSGVDRISFGVQSLDDGELGLLGRVHDRQAAIEGVALARQAGFENLNLDLIFGLPGQKVETWRRTLEGALALGPEHLSLYALTLEEHTPLATAIWQGHLPAIEEDTAADMYELAEARLAEVGYEHYEISNWARPGRECRHNLIYWRNGDYLGIGAGAWSHRGDRRWGNVRNPDAYITRVSTGESLVDEEDSISREKAMSDTLILGLRRVGGIARDNFIARFGLDPIETYGDRIEWLKDAGLLEVDSIGIRLTARGRLLGNEVFEQFLPVSNRGDTETSQPRV